MGELDALGHGVDLIDRLRAMARHLDVDAVIELPELLSDVEGWVGMRERHRQEERALVLAPHIVELDAARADAAFEHGVAAMGGRVPGERALPPIRRPSEMRRIDIRGEPLL